MYDGPALLLDLTGRAAGTYRYRARACNPAGCTADSASASVTMVYPPAAAPTITIAARFAPGAITVNWSAVTGANRYQLQERVGSGAWASLYDGTARTFSTPARQVGSYGYRVAACNGAGCGAWSAIQSTSVVGPPTLEPTISAATLVSVPHLSLGWSAPANSERFELQESANGGAWTQVQNSAATSFSAGRGEGRYGYRVRACNFAGCGPMSGVVTIVVSLPPATPVFYHAQWLTTRRPPYQVQCDVGWHPVTSATRYELQGEGGGTSLYSGPNAYVSEYGGAYCSHSYRVRACNAGGCSAWSSPDYPVTRGFMEEGL